MKYSKHRRSRRLSKSRKSVNSQKRPKSRKISKSQRRRKTRKISKSQKRRKTRKIFKSSKRSKRRKSRKSSKSRESMKVMRGGVKVLRIEDEHNEKYKQLRTKLQSILDSELYDIGSCKLLIRLFPSFDLTQTAVEQRSEQQSRVMRPTRQQSTDLEIEKRKVMTAAFYPEFDFTRPRQDSDYETIRDTAKKNIISLFSITEQDKHSKYINDETTSVNDCIDLFIREKSILPRFVKPTRQLSEAQLERSRLRKLAEQKLLQSQTVGETSGTGDYGPVPGLAETGAYGPVAGLAKRAVGQPSQGSEGQTIYGVSSTSALKASHYGRVGDKTKQGPPSRPTAPKP